MKSFVAVLLVAPLLTACVALTVAGGDDASAGRTYGSNAHATDADITAAVRSRLISDSMISARQIGVSTHNGIVTLTGSVVSVAIRDRIIRIARAVRGVRKVEPRITVVMGH